jgi:hypothetical protein
VPPHLAEVHVPEHVAPPEVAFQVPDALVDEAKDP